MPPSSPPSDRLVGRRLGRYQLVQLLGTGGTANVYLAEREGDASARVALKILRHEHQTSHALVSRFEREAAAAARVRHPNVLAASELELLPDGTRLFAMELLEGLDLADTLSYAGSLSPERSVRIAVGIADALGAAHAKGVVHRDVKPENVFLVHSPDGREVVKLLDFGFAHLAGDPRGSTESKRITARHTVVGTPEYMAPEQAQGAPATAAADVYSLGVVLFEMLTGRVPFVGDSFPAIAHQHAESPLPSMSKFHPGLVLSPSLSGLVERSLAKTASERFSGGADIASALRKAPEAKA